ncbi:MAG: aldo/keto reductase [Bacteroidales bacterium]|nr:aldo/keto reductase [Bacteroidales bacterium]MBN2699741.1 aldo/keto reductase [Bacteroidales bacterium]
MPDRLHATVSRREFMKLSAAAAAGLTIFPAYSFGMDQIPEPMKRKFGKIDFDVTTLGLGGQASLQWTPDDVDPVKIILKAFKLGINYFDTSNLYQGSQLNYGKAFRLLNLIPDEKDYDRSLRDSFFLTTKTHMRWAKGGYPDVRGVSNATQGDHGEGAVADLKRSLTQLFGDGKGYYPEGAYVNMILIHSLNNTADIDVLYKGLGTPLNKDENFGALVALRDFRDGTNLTGMNPKHEKLVRHIGFSGHWNSPAMMEMIRRDEYELLDAMLVAVNPNDKRYLSHQNNVIPVARAKNMGIIAMKVFADGTMYTKEPRWSGAPEDVVRTVGSRSLPSRPLVEYALTTPGVHTAIIGIGQISDDHLKCQLVQNFYAAQILPEGMSNKKRRQLEKKTGQVRDGKTNYFQMEQETLSPPANLALNLKDNPEITWDSAIASDEPISHYEVYREDELVGLVAHYPQTGKTPFYFRNISEGGKYRVYTVDKAGRKSGSDEIMISV